MKESQNHNTIIDPHTPFDPSNLTKEEERLFFGERLYENFQVTEFSVNQKKSIKSVFEYNSHSFLSSSHHEENCCQKLLIPYQNRAKSFFDVFMMFFVAYSVFTNLF